MRGPLFFLLIGFVALTSACSTGFVSNGMNMASLQIVDFAKLGQLKQGESCATTSLGLFTGGSEMILDAARAGGLPKVGLVEYKTSANPLFSKQCAVVYGQ